MTRPTSLLVAITLAAACNAASAQESGTVGLTVGVVAEPVGGDFSPLVAATWNLTERLAVRPTARFRRTEQDDSFYWWSTDTTTQIPPGSTASTLRMWGGGGTVLWRLTYGGDTSTYVTAGYEFDRYSLEEGDQRRSPTRTTHSWLAAVGNEHVLRDDVAVFVEVGVRYETAERFKNVTALSSRLGLVLYF